MENCFKLRISSIFHHSFGSCRSRNSSGIMEKSLSVTRQRVSNPRHNFHEFGLRGKKQDSSERRGLPALKGSIAVVKSSSDPYNDFKTSMVDMILEKQMFSVEDLELLSQCFLWLNSDRHRSIILEAFMEVFQSLFT